LTKTCFINSSSSSTKKL